MLDIADGYAKYRCSLRRSELNKSPRASAAGPEVESSLIVYCWEVEGHVRGAGSKDSQLIPWG